MENTSMWCQWTLQMRFPSHPWEGPRSTKPFSYFSTQSSVFWNVFHNTHSQAPKASLKITLRMLKQFSLISNAIISSHTGPQNPKHCLFLGAMFHELLKGAILESCFSSFR